MAADDDTASDEPSRTRKLSDVTVSCGVTVMDAEAFFTPKVAIVPVAVINTVNLNSFSAFAVAEETAEIVAEASTTASAEAVDEEDALILDDASITFTALDVTDADPEIAAMPTAVFAASATTDAVALIWAVASFTVPSYPNKRAPKLPEP